MDFTRLMQNRRSVNFFDPAKPVSDDELRKVVALASLAPSSFNLQPWNLIVVRSPEARARLRKLAMDQAKVTEAPVVLIVLADTEGYQEGNPAVERVWRATVDNGYMKPDQKAWFLDAARRLYGTRAQSFGVKNASFFAMALMLAAAEAGLDTHPMDGFDHDAVKEEFGVPRACEIPLLVAVGHFDASKRLLPRNWRKPYGEIVLSEL